MDAGMGNLLMIQKNGINTDILDKSFKLLLSQRNLKELGGCLSIICVNILTRFIFAEFSLTIGKDILLKLNGKEKLQEEVIHFLKENYSVFNSMECDPQTC